MVSAAMGNHWIRNCNSDWLADQSRKCWTSCVWRNISNVARRIHADCWDFNKFISKRGESLRISLFSIPQKNGDFRMQIFVSKSHNTPFVGEEFMGKVVGVVNKRMAHFWWMIHSAMEHNIAIACIKTQNLNKHDDSLQLMPPERSQLLCRPDIWTPARGVEAARAFPEILAGGAIPHHT